MCSHSVAPGSSMGDPDQYDNPPVTFDVNKLDKYGDTALDWAAERVRAECASVLRSYGALTGAELRASGR